MTATDRDRLAVVPDLDPDAEDVEPFSWPESWTVGAVDAVETVLEVAPDLSGPAWASLEQVGALISSADRLDALAIAAGLTATGSTGQEILHPAIPEARQARTAAAQILARLGDVTGRTAGETLSTRQARNARARWSRAGR